MSARGKGVRQMKKFRVKELAQARGLTQEEVAMRTNGRVTISTVRRMWQNKGVQNPLPDTLEAVAEVLGVQPDELTFDDGQPELVSATLLGNQRALIAA
jgi:transcriptional regulator with XRE-family HTH domain